MKNILIAYPVKHTAIQLKNVLDENGFYVSHICATGASVLRIADGLNGGVVVCAALLGDMSAHALAEQLPAGFDVLALSKTGRADYLGNCITLPLPLDRDEFVQTVAVLVSSRSSFTQRDRSDEEYIRDAKAILMQTRQFSETQAHRFLQSRSMTEGMKIEEIAREIIGEFE